jgi:hypothetical protein
MSVPNKIEATLNLLIGIQVNGRYVPKAPIAGTDINGCYLEAAIRN